MSQTYGYTRVSTDAQAKEGEGLEVQQRQIDGYAQMLGLSVAQTFVEEGVSGSVALASRPAGKRLLGVLCPGDVVIASKLDRMFRSALDALNALETLKRRGIALHLLDLGGNVMANGISKLFFTVVAAFAESERDRIRERVRECKRELREQGRFCGGSVPFGYGLEDRSPNPLRPELYLCAIPAQQVVLAEMWAMRDDGMTLGRIREYVSGAGYRLSLSAVHKILTTRVHPDAMLQN